MVEEEDASGDERGSAAVEEAGSLSSTTAEGDKGTEGRADDMVPVTARDWGGKEGRIGSGRKKIRE